MSVIGTISIGMTVNTNKFTKALKTASKQMDSFVAGFAGGLASIAGAAVFSQIGHGIVEMGKQASELNEQVSKSQQVFGDASAKVEADAQAMGDAFGYPKSQFIDGASSIGLIAKASGLTQEAAADLGSSFSTLAADVSSFYNKDVDQALDAIRSGLVGEAEPMRAFGVLLNEAAVSTEAMRLGLSKTGKELTEGQKVQARASLITKGLADAQGDLARTAGGAANQVRTIWGRLTNLGADVGTAMQPAIDAVLSFANGGIAKLSSAFQAATPYINTFVAAIVELYTSELQLVMSAFSALGETLTANSSMFEGWFKTVISIIDGASMLFRNLPDFFEIAGLKIQEVATNIVEYLAVLPQNLAIIGEWIGTNWYQLVFTGLDAVLTLFINLGTNIRNLGTAIVGFLSDPTQGFQFNFTPLLDGFKSTVAELPELLKPELTSMQDLIDEKLGVIGDREAKRAIDAAAATAKKLTDAKSPAAKLAEDAMPKPGEEPKFAGALQLGSADAISAINQFQAGSGDSSIKAVAKETKAQTKVLESIDKKIGGATKPAASTPIMAF